MGPERKGKGLAGCSNGGGNEEERRITRSSVESVVGAVRQIRLELHNLHPTGIKFSKSAIRKYCERNTKLASKPSRASNLSNSATFKQYSVVA